MDFLFASSLSKQPEWNGVHQANQHNAAQPTPGHIPLTPYCIPSL